MISKKLSAHLRHLRYELFHKWYVLTECFKAGLYWRGIVHDMSKFLPDEWFPYVEFFYNGKKTKDEFERASSLHRNRNKHHYQCWIIQQEDGSSAVLPMEEPYITEMICDWIGIEKAMKALGHRSLESDPLCEVQNYWIKTKNTKEMHEQTKREIDKRLGITE